MKEQYVFTPDTNSGFVPLSRSRHGKLVRKEILRVGDLNYPGVRGGKVKIDNVFLSNVVKNFENKVCDIVQFPLADKSNSHTEDPLRNGGEVVKLEHKDDALYAYIDVRKPEVLEGIQDKTIIGASAMLALDYTDTRTGERAGPTLLHVAATNRPHVLELEDYEVIAASVDSNGEAVLLTADHDPKENTLMTTKEEAFEYLKSEHNIDVSALLESAEANTGVAELTSKLAATLSTANVLKLSNGEDVDIDDIVLSVSKVVEDNNSLSSRIETLELSNRKSAAEAEVDKLIDGGYVLDTQRDALVELKLSNEETFKKFIPETPIIKLSGEATGFAPADGAPEAAVEAEIDRLSAIAS